jgi:cytochrome c oxidase assembly protein subunit 15
MTALARISLLLVIILVVVSAYLRLHASGIGCPDWPACYGHIGAAPEETIGVAESAYQRIVAESDAPLAWAAPLHRLVASLLGLAIVLLTVLAFRARQHRIITLALLALTVLLAVLGLRSGNLYHPAIVMGNLVGGFTMLGLLGWLVFRLQPGGARYTETRIRHLRPALLVALFCLGLQIVLGGLTSANFAATACASFPDCNGQWFPDATIYSALRIDRPHEINAQGFAVGSYERPAIHQAHRLGAVLATLAVLVVVFSAFYQSTGGLRGLAVAAGLLVLIEFGVGVAAILFGVPIALAVSHNWIAGLLLLVLLKMSALSQERWSPG